MDYEVEIVPEGRGGRYYYIEEGSRLRFEWDFSTEGVSIEAPTPEAWNEYCDAHAAGWAKNRREEILLRLAEEVRRKKAKGAKITINNHWVHLKFREAGITSLILKLLG